MLCTSGLSPSVPVTLILPGVIFRLYGDKSLQHVLVNYPASAIDSLCTRTFEIQLQQLCCSTSVGRSSFQLGTLSDYQNGVARWLWRKMFANIFLMYLTPVASQLLRTPVPVSTQLNSPQDKNRGSIADTQNRDDTVYLTTQKLIHHPGPIRRGHIYCIRLKNCPWWVMGLSLQVLLIELKQFVISHRRLYSPSTLDYTPFWEDDLLCVCCVCNWPCRAAACVRGRATDVPGETWFRSGLFWLVRWVAWCRSRDEHGSLKCSLEAFAVIILSWEGQ